jgi:Leu/Phe-tRNA-protein transferase
MINKELIYQRAIERWGISLQSVVVIEEMSELTKEITKTLRGNKFEHRNESDFDNIIDEIADVEIMLEQLKWWIPKATKEVEVFKKNKLKRLQGILDNLDKKDELNKQNPSA